MFFSFNTFDAKLGGDAKIEYEEFQKWCNGGGLFHKSACIDPSARIDIGALVHSDSVVGANVYVGSGSVVGPAVTIGQSTRTGYSSSLILEFNWFKINVVCSAWKFTLDYVW